MKKVILKSILAVVAVAASCLGAWKTYDAYGSVDNSLLMENLEALSEEPESEGNNEEWYLHHFECNFPIKTDAELKKVILFFHGKKSAEIGVVVDLSDATQFFNHNPEDGEGPCEKGNQITCANLILRILGV